MEKNEIIIETNNLEPEKKFYFLYHKEKNKYSDMLDENQENKEEHEYLKELNEDLVEIYIDQTKINFEKYFIPKEDKSYTIKLKFKKK